MPLLRNILKAWRRHHKHRKSGTWSHRDELAQSYLERSSYAYGGGREGKCDEKTLNELVGALDAVVQNQDAREFDLLDSDEFAAFEGGLAAAAEYLKGVAPALYHNDHSRPQRPVIRRLEEEIAMIVRARAANPKWIKGVCRHGYKGGAELAQTVANLHSFAALTDAVQGHHFESLFEAYLIAPETLEFLRRHNPAALREIAGHFLDAIERQFWQPQRNSAYGYLMELSGKDQGS